MITIIIKNEEKDAIIAALRPIIDRISSMIIQKKPIKKLIKRFLLKKSLTKKRLVKKKLIKNSESEVVSQKTPVEFKNLISLAPKSIEMQKLLSFLKQIQLINLKKKLKDEELLISFGDVTISFVISDDKEEFFNTDNKKNETILKGFTLTLNVSGIEGISIDKLCCNVKLEST